MVDILVAVLHIEAILRAEGKSFHDIDIDIGGSIQAIVFGKSLLVVHHTPRVVIVRSPWTGSEHIAILVIIPQDSHPDNSNRPAEPSEEIAFLVVTFTIFHFS